MELNRLDIVAALSGGPAVYMSEICFEVTNLYSNKKENKYSQKRLEKFKSYITRDLDILSLGDVNGFYIDISCQQGWDVIMTIRMTKVNALKLMKIDKMIWKML